MQLKSVLTQKEREVLTKVQLRADVSATEIRKRTGFRSETIRQCLRSMCERGVAWKTIVVDLERLGLKECNIYFEHRPLDKVDFSSPSLARFSCVSEYTGPYEFRVAGQLRNIAALGQLISHAVDTFSLDRVPRAHSIVLSQSLFGRKDLSHDKPSQEYIGFPRYSSEDPQKVELDDLDEVLLHRMSEKNWSIRSLASDLRIPHSTATFRLRRLQARGVIRGFVYLSEGGDVVWSKFLLQVRVPTQPFYDRLFEFCRNSRYATYLAETLGGWDYEINVVAPTMAEYRAFSAELQTTFGDDITSIKSLMWMGLSTARFYQPFGV